MPRVCTVCSHPKREEIDAEIVCGEPNRRISSNFGLSESAIRRHKKHTAATLAKAIECREINLGNNVLGRLEELWCHGKDALENARRAGNWKLVLAAIRELKGVLAGLHEIERDAVALEAASRPIEFSVFHGDKPAERLPIPKPRPAMIQ